MNQAALCLDEFFRHLREHRGVVVLAAAIMALAFFLLALFLIILVNVQGVTSGISSDIRLRIYLNNDALGNATRDALRSRLEQEPGVNTITYVSKEKAFEQMKSQLKDQAVLLEGLGLNPLPASFELTMREDDSMLDGLPQLAERIESFSGVDQVRYGREWIGRFQVLATFLRIFGLGVGVLVIVAVVAIVASTIRFMIDARREDIEVLKIVGASNLVITVPYVAEGVLLGVTAAAVAVGFLASVLAFVGPDLEVMGGFLFGRGGLRFLPWELAVVLLGGGATLGGAGSLISVRRFFRVASV